jgi:hypothetical protein
MTALRALLALVVCCTAALAARVDPASACSCALGDPRAMLAQADGAFVGRFVGKRVPRRPVRSSAAGAVYVFRLVDAVKGRFGRRVAVHSATSGAACGLEVRRGQTIGLFLLRAHGRWESSLCQQVDPARLRAAARPLPRPNGRGPAAVLVGGRFGSARSLALDARGRTLAYGRGTGGVAAFGVCPGSRAAVELVAGRHAYLAVRALPRLRLLARRPLGVAVGSGFTPSVSCRSRNGSRAAVFATRPFRSGAGSRVLRIRGPSVRTVWTGTALFGAFHGRTAFLAAGRRGARLVRVDLSTGRDVTLARVPPTTGGVVVRPDGREVAAVSRAWVTVVQSRGGRAQRVRISSCCIGQVVWLPGRRLAVLPDDAPRILDARLRTRARILNWTSSVAVARDTRLVGIGWDGRLLIAPDSGGRARLVRYLPGTFATAMAAVPPVS